MLQLKADSLQILPNLSYDNPTGGRTLQQGCLMEKVPVAKAEVYAYGCISCIACHLACATIHGIFSLC